MNRDSAKNGQHNLGGNIRPHTAACFHSQNYGDGGYVNPASVGAVGSAQYNRLKKMDDDIDEAVKGRISDNARSAKKDVEDTPLGDKYQSDTSPSLFARAKKALGFADGGDYSPASLGDRGDAAASQMMENREAYEARNAPEPSRETSSPGDSEQATASETAKEIDQTAKEAVAPGAGATTKDYPEHGEDAAPASYTTTPSKPAETKWRDTKQAEMVRQAAADLGGYGDTYRGVKAIKKARQDTEDQVSRSAAARTAAADSNDQVSRNAAQAGLPMTTGPSVRPTASDEDQVSRGAKQQPRTTRRFLSFDQMLNK